MGPDAVVEATLLRAARVFSGGMGSLKGILAEADARLSAKLHRAAIKGGGAKATFTEAHALLYRKQIKLVQEYLDQRLLGLTHSQATKAIAVSVKGTTALAKTLEAHFSGISRPLALEAQAMQDSLVRGTGASLLQQHLGSVNRYGKAMISDFERVMRVSQIEGLSQHETISRLVAVGELGGINAHSLHARSPNSFPAPTNYRKRRYWAERIVRTETAYAYNAAALRTIQTSKITDFPDMQKKILATFDARTAADSIAVHGQIRDVAALFRDGAGREYLHPPARPNDRETVVPWRPHWGDLPSTKQASAPQIAAAQLTAQGGAVTPQKKLAARLAAKVEIANAKQAAKAALSKGQVQLQQDQTTAALTARRFAPDMRSVARAQELAREQVQQAYAKAQQELQQAKVEAAAQQFAKLREEAQGFADSLKVLSLDVPETKAKLAHLNALKKQGKANPALFAQVYKITTGKALSKSATKALAKTQKAPALKILEASGHDVSVFKKGAKTTFTLKDAGSGFIDVYEADKKVAYFNKEGDVFVVTPPAGIGLDKKSFADQNNAAIYAKQVGATIEAKKLVVTQTKNDSAPVVVKPTPGWSKAWQGPMRNKRIKNDQARLLDRGLEQDSLHGVAVAGDGDQVENFQINFTTEIVDGKRFTVARFKFVGQFDRDEFKEVNFEGFPMLDGLKSTVLNKTMAKKVYDDRLPSTGVRSAKFGKAEARHFFDNTGNKASALHNMVEIRFPETTGKGKRWSTFAETAKQFGIDMKQPTPEDLERYKRVKILRSVFNASNAEVRDLDKAWEKRLLQAPFIKEIEADAELREVAPGQLSLYSPTLAARYKAAGITRLEHSIFSQTPEVFEQLFVNQRGLLSSRERFQRGIVFRGMSTDEDFNTGGADSVFLRSRSGPAPAPYKNSGTVIEIDSDELGRLDLYAFNEDRYGRAGERQRDKRVGLEQVQDLVAKNQLGEGNEVMVQRMVPIESIRRVRTSPVIRDTIMKVFADNGIAQINGIPVAEFVQSAE